jgi:hypothetical protein
MRIDQAWHQDSAAAVDLQPMLAVSLVDRLDVDPLDRRAPDEDIGDG